MKLLPLGSIIKVNGHKLCIIGYGSVDRDTASVSGYFVVLYPIGFTNIDKTFFIPCKTEIEVIAEGYKTAPSEKVLDTLAKSFEMAQKAPYEDLLKIKEVFKEVASKQKGANEE